MTLIVHPKTFHAFYKLIMGTVFVWELNPKLIIDTTFTESIMTILRILLINTRSKYWRNHCHLNKSGNETNLIGSK